MFSFQCTLSLYVVKIKVYSQLTFLIRYKVFICPTLRPVQKMSYNSFLAIINGYCTWRIIPTLQFMYTNGSVLGGNFYCKNEWYIATSSCWAEILFISIESIKYVMKFSMNMLIEIYGCSRRSNIYTTAYSPIQCNEII